MLILTDFSLKLVTSIKSVATTDKFEMVVARADATAKLNWFTLFGSYP